MTEFFVFDNFLGFTLDPNGQAYVTTENISVYPNLFIDRYDGSVYLTVEGYSRFVGVKRKVLRDRLGELELYGCRIKFEREFTPVMNNDTPKTFKLLNEELISFWLPDDDIQITKKIMLTGFRDYFYNLVGYDLTH